MLTLYVIYYNKINIKYHTLLILCAILFEYIIFTMCSYDYIYVVTMAMYSCVWTGHGYMDRSWIHGALTIFVVIIVWHKYPVMDGLSFLW